MKFKDIYNHVFLLSDVDLTINQARHLGTCSSLPEPGLMVTAAHVVKNSKNLMIKINDQFTEEGYQINRDTSGYRPVKIVAHDPFSDICVLKVQDEFKSILPIMSCDELDVGDQVTVFGFPHSNLNRMVLTQQTCEVGAKILLSNGGINFKNIVLNIQSRPGQSGGPVISNKDGKLVAILLGAFAPEAESAISLGGIDPQTLHQTTHAISAEYILEMI